MERTCSTIATRLDDELDQLGHVAHVVHEVACVPFWLDLGSGNCHAEGAEFPLADFNLSSGGLCKALSVFCLHKGIRCLN